MTVPVPFTFWTSRLEHCSGHPFVSPLLLPGVFWPGGDAAGLAAALVDALDAAFLRQGRFSALLDHASGLRPESFRVVLGIPASPDRHLYPAMELSFAAFRTPAVGGGYMAFVPALGVSVSGRDPADLGRQTADAIRLEFARHKRLASVRGLLAAQWFEKVRLEETRRTVSFYTLAELEEIRRGRARLVLPEAAEPLSPGPARLCGMEEPFDRLVRALRGRYARSVLLCGPSGCGKTALVEELCRRRKDHAEIAGKEVWETTAARLIQKLSALGGWEKTLPMMVRELRDRGDLLFVRNLADLFEVGQYVGNDVSIAEGLRSSIERGEITAVAECTPEQLSRLDVRSPGYSALFHVLRVQEPPAGELEDIVRRRVDGAEPEAVREALRLQRRYSPYSGYPGKTVRFFEALLAGRPANAPGKVGRGDVLRQFCEETGMPPFIVDPAVPLPVGEMDRHFRTNVFGQDEAVDTLIDLLAAVKTGLVREGKPIASLLFTGPTGVGKTELAKVLAEFMFGSRSRMIRFDMSEYSDLLSVLRLTGEQGDRREGLLTGAARQEPFSVLLFDEIEKAHPVFFDSLLQVLGEGRLTDGRGRVADFCSTIVVMTSNLGASDLPRGALGFGRSADEAGRIAEHFRRAVEAHFRPELFNRLDRVVAFRPLPPATIRLIVDREMRRLRLRPGLAHRDVTFRVEEGALDLLGERGYDAVYGARQLQRALREELVLPLASRLNRYGAGLAVEASASAEEGGIALRVRGVERKAFADLALEGTELTFREMADALSKTRRLAEAVEAGSAVLSLRSALQRLDIRRRKNEDGFWADAASARQYKRYGEILDAWKACRAEAAGMEADALLSLLDPSLPPPSDLLRREGEYRRKSWEVLLDLYDAYVPGQSRCMICLYGTHEAIHRLWELYVALAGSMEYSVQTQGVWHIPGKNEYEVRPRGVRPSSGNALLTGLEIHVTGRAAMDFFAAETGRHVWITPDREKAAFAVTVVASSPAEYGEQRPQGIHRKAFPSEFHERRTYRPGGISDPVFKLEVSMEEAVPALRERLMEALRRSVTGELAR